MKKEDPPLPEDLLDLILVNVKIKTPNPKPIWN